MDSTPKRIVRPFTEFLAAKQHLPLRDPDGLLWHPRMVLTPDARRRLEGFEEAHARRIGGGHDAFYDISQNVGFAGVTQCVPALTQANLPWSSKHDRY
eukprot:9621900-Alexandrium_andersonii.AAC.1